MKIAISISAIFLAFVGLFAQNRSHNPGAPISQYFDPDVYQASPGNHSIIQAPSGFIYVGNDDGVLEFDGANWRVIPMPNLSPVYSLAIDKTGIIYVGAQSELGYLELSPTGEMQYRSLLEFIPQENQNFSSVNKVFATDNGIFFHSSLYLFRWKEGEMHIWPAEIQFYSGYYINGNVSLLSIGDGIMKVEGDSLVHYIDKDVYGDIPVMSIISHQKNKALLLLISGELKTYSESEELADFPTTPFVSNYLRNNEPLGMIRLPDQRIAITTSRGGILIINQNGQPDQIVDTPTGLQEVRALYLDLHQGLWLAMDEGIARVELFSPYSFWGESQGLNGGVTEVIYAHNHLYIGNRRGIFRQVFAKSGILNSTFSFIPGSPGAFTDMELHLDTLFVGAASSLRKILADGGLSAGLQLPVIKLHAYEKNPGFLLIGFQDGIGVLQKRDDRIGWEFTSHFPEFSTDAFSFEEDSSGAIWVGSAYNGVRRFLISDFQEMVDTSDSELVPYLIDLKPEIRFYGKSKGVPKGKTQVFKLNESIWIASEKGLRKFDKKSEKFIWEPYMNLDSNIQIINVAVSAFGDLWVILNENGTINVWRLAQIEENGFYWEKNQIARITHSGSPTYLYPDPNSPEILWIGAKNGLYRYNENYAKSDSIAFSAYVREVRSLKGDSILVDESKLPYSSNSLRFHFAAPSFTDVGKTVYQYYLDGFDSKWSRWSTKSEKEYTNLPEGRYYFRVRAMDPEGNISQEGVWQFYILPPWYRTWWAFTLYGFSLILVFISISYFYNQWRTQKMRAKNRELENLVEVRTEEIKEKNIQLADSLKHLKETQQQLILQEKMASLGQVTLGIAHEIKNPLNFVKNFAEGADELIQELYENMNQSAEKSESEKLQFLIETLSVLKETNQDILAHGERANRIVNSMMDHANNNRSQKQKTDINQLIEEQSSLAKKGYKSYIAEFNPEITKDLSKDIPEVSLLPHEFGRVIINLVTNALYAMESKQESAGIAYKPELTIRSTYVKDMAKIYVRDNGIGISKEILSRIFEPFFTTKPTGMGNTGLGLSISYDIVTRGLQGTIEVNSEKGAFTEFIISIPVRD